MTADAERPCIVVAGLGRCGTSMMMQMLQAGGVPCLGHWPDFEPDESHPLHFDPAAFAARRGVAQKILDPHHLPIGEMPNHVVLWLDRKSREQARSQLKLVAATRASVPIHRDAVRAVEAALRRERDPARRAIGIQRQCDSMTLRFEEILISPKLMAVHVASFLGQRGWPGLHFDRMAEVVSDRPPECLSGFLETQQMQVVAM